MKRVVDSQIRLLSMYFVLSIVWTGLSLLSIEIDLANI